MHSQEVRSQDRMIFTLIALWAGLMALSLLLAP